MMVSTDSGCLGAHATAALHSIGWPAVAAPAAAAGSVVMAAAAEEEEEEEELDCWGATAAPREGAEKKERGCVRCAPIRDAGCEEEEAEEGDARARVSVVFACWW